MQRSFHTFNKILLFAFYLVLAPPKSFAQVVPDDTLGTESSIIRSVDELRDSIEGGATRGENLFHSFEQFAIQEGARVDFANPGGISNIFSRVTGESISEIFGTLGVDGGANLFLMNPNGIVFGENSVIDVGGSFLATTAESIEFNSGNSFSIKNPSTPQLTINFPLGLSLDSPGDIIVRGTGHNLFFSNTAPTVRTSASPGLEVSSGKSLALVGNGINLDGGVLLAEEGHIEIGSVEQGFVSFDSNLEKFNYDNVLSFADVNLTNTSWIDASITSLTTESFASAVNIEGENIVIKDESVIFVQNQSENVSGDININSENSITISKVEINPTSRIPGGVISESIGSGGGSNINLNSPNISLLEGGSVISRSLNLVKAGDIAVEASEKLELIGVSAEDTPPIASNITNAAFPVGETGKTTIKTPSLVIQDGATITNFVAGQAVGNPILVDSDNIKLSGTDGTSGIFVSSISSNALGASRAADIFVNASSIEVENGAAIAALVFDFAQPGNISINAPDSIEVRGINSQTQNISSIASTIFLPNDASREAFGIVSVELPTDPTGNSGGLNINTSNLKITDGAVVTVLNQGTGDAGNLEIDAESIDLNNQGAISASTVSGEGGNITIDVEKLELANESQITASAGGQGNGGNITIDSNTILGILNSDITANAIAGDGGNITINSDFIVGLQERSQLTPFNDITATSELGIDGTVTINTPDSNLEEQVYAGFRIYDSPENRELLEQRCLNPRNPQGKIINVGRAGVPANPDNFFDDESVVRIEGVLKDTETDREYMRLKPLFRAPHIGEDEPKRANDVPTDWVEGDPIVEPNAIKVGADGETYLVTETTIGETDLKDANSGVCTREKT